MLTWDDTPEQDYRIKRVSDIMEEELNHTPLCTICMWFKQHTIASWRAKAPNKQWHNLCTPHRMELGRKYTHMEVIPVNRTTDPRLNIRPLLKDK